MPKQKKTSSTKVSEPVAPGRRARNASRAKAPTVESPAVEAPKIPTANEIATALISNLSRSQDTTLSSLLTQLRGNQSTDGQVTQGQAEHMTVDDATSSQPSSVNGASSVLGSTSHGSLVKQKSSNGSATSLDTVTNKLLQASLSNSTRASYQRMLNCYEQFCQEHFPQSSVLPSTHIMIAHFISYLFIKNYQPSTIASFVSAISYVHKINFKQDPTDSFFIKKVLKGVQNLRGSCDSRLPITKEILSKLISATEFVVHGLYNQLLLK
ncbi:uncharacterized protein LOC134270615 [Saccostrea cucullata]|uniref:uncharacterized protein LOC134270615 n=1 Tax=Saccostrea cuccullata TaxID=36930 RepID=UPI002ED16631